MVEGSITFIIVSISQFNLLPFFFRDDRDRNDEIQKLIARAEFNARQYMTNFNFATLSSPSTLVRILPVSSPTKLT
jgi:hypothetical protein